MHFKTEAQRLAHPQACLIPRSLLSGVYSNTLSEFQLDLMRTPLDELTLSVESIKDHEKNDKLRSFLCIILGHPSATDDEFIELADKLDILACNRFSCAALTGRLTLINRFTISLLPADVLNLVKDYAYEAFRWAVWGGHLPILERLLVLAPAEILNMIETHSYSAFRSAAADGSVPMIEKLMELAPSKIISMVQALDYGAFQLAAEGGHIPVLEKLIERAPTEKLKMISADDYKAFRIAAEKGHLAVMQRLIDFAPAEARRMIGANRYGAFRMTAKEGNLDIMQRLAAFDPTNIFALIYADNYGAFREAARNGHLPVIEKLMTLVTSAGFNIITAMIEADDYGAFRLAAQEGHLPIMVRLKGLLSSQKERLDMMLSCAFRYAAGEGNLVLIERLAAFAPDDVLHMIKTDNYAAFRSAARGRHLPVMNKLFELAPDERINMIKVNNYLAFRNAASNGNLAIIDRLIELAPNEVENMITNRSDPESAPFNAFKNAVWYDYHPIINRLLSFSIQMAHAEMHESEYHEFTHPYITAKLASLRNQRLTLETANPHAVFDLANAEEAKCCFYIIRNLIRRQNPGLLDDLRFLLEIPTIKALAHQEVTEGTPNELVRLAIILGNQGAAEILLNIPAVRALAIENDFYRAESHGLIDLSALAHDRESSMKALSTGEQDRLAAAFTRYQPIMKETGVAHLFDHLREKLVERYQEHPATLIIAGKETILPVDWVSFSQLFLTPGKYEEALKAYYRHKGHSALRYLSCPNPWMAPEASYVNVNPMNTHERWSTFDEYKPLIVMLWLAAQDETMAPTDGHTLEGRIEHFIDELALIGRAHNWDHSRIRITGGGIALLNEEYDDLTGDRPSCFSGVKRRLFQSVIGHPLLKFLTEEDIKAELRDFVRSHFTRLINDENREALRTALTNYYSSVELADAALLRALNISNEQQAAFIQQLTTKYGPQFSNEPRFKSTIEKEFTLIEKESNPSDCMHALKFAGLVNLDQLLQANVACAAGAGAIPMASIGAVGFFAATMALDEASSADKPGVTL